MREKTNTLQGYEKITFQVYAGGPPVGKAISLKVLGHDDAMRRTFADEIEAYLAGIEGVKGIDRDDKLGKEQIQIDLPVWGSRWQMWLRMFALPMTVRW